MSFLVVQDPKLDLADVNDHTYIVKRGGNIIYQRQIPQSGVSVLNTNYQLNNVGSQTGVSRELILHITGTYTVIGTNFTPGPLPTGAVGLKSFAANRTVQSVQIVANGANETYLNYQLMDWLSKIKTDPTKLNFWNNLAQDVLTNYTAANSSPFNPISSYLTTPNGDGVNKARTIGVVSAICDSPTQATITLDWYEPLVCPFSSVSPNDVPALYNLDTCNITVNWFRQMLDLLAININSFGPGATCSDSSCYFTPATQDLWVSYVQKDNLVLPATSMYQFPSYQMFSQSIASIPAGTTNVTTANIQINSMTVPSKIVVFVREQEVSRSITRPDRYAVITALQVQFNNRQPVFQGCNIRQLYNISRRNGNTQSFEVFSGQQLDYSNANCWGAGSIMVIDPALDLNLPENLTVNSEGKYTVNIQVSYNNPSVDAINNPIAYAYCVSDKLLIRSGRSYNTNYLQYTEEQVLSANSMATSVQLMDYDEALHNNMMLSGGSFKSFFKNVFHGIKKGIHFINKHKKEIKQGYDLAKRGYDAYNKYKGSGEDMDDGMYLQYN